MQEEFFYRFGKFIYHFRWLIIIVSIVMLIACVPILPKFMDSFKAIGFSDPQAESSKVNDLLNKQLGYGYDRFIIIYSSKTLHAGDAKFKKEIKDSLSHLNKFPIKHDIIYPDPTTNQSQISKDKHTAYAVVVFKNHSEMSSDLLANFRAQISKPPHLTMQVGGEPIFEDDIKLQTQQDLFLSDLIATPVAIITMLIIFGTVVAASLPILLGGTCALFILATLSLMASQFGLSVFTINIALLLGLCLTLDYCLFIISRFREEIKARLPAATKNKTSKIKDKRVFLSDAEMSEAIAITFITAGKAIFFSGIAVFISLSALLLFPIDVLFSVGVGGLVSVFFSVLIALMLLPSILSVLNTRINSLSIPFLNNERFANTHLWKWLVEKVTQYKYISFFSMLILLLVIGLPCLHIKLGISDFRILPQNMESRTVFESFKKEFGEPQLAPLFVLVKTNHGNVLADNNVEYLYNLVRKIKQNPNVGQVDSIVSFDSKYTKQQYIQLYKHPTHFTADLKKMLRLTTKKDYTVITVFSKYSQNATQTKQLVKDLRAMKQNHLTLGITGETVSTIDVLHSISKTFPYAIIWILGFSYLILLILLRSLFLPFKAIVMNILSLFASYGVLVFVIQDGHFHQLLNFEPQGMIDITLLIIIFCALFGVSMDYEVFLLTRIKEYYEQTKDNIASILYGIDHSSKLITSAAIIVILLCVAFMSAQILLVKAFGLGIAVAVFIDAFLIRTILVPSIMAIFKSWNWYLPKWLDKILPKISFNPHRK